MALAVVRASERREVRREGIGEEVEGPARLEQAEVIGGIIVVRFAGGGYVGTVESLCGGARFLQVIILALVAENVAHTVEVEVGADEL